MWLRAQSALHGKARMRGRILPECTVCLSVLLTYQLLVMFTKSPPVVFYQPGIILPKRENKIVSFTERYKRNSWRFGNLTFSLSFPNSVDSVWFQVFSSFCHQPSMDKWRANRYVTLNSTYNIKNSVDYLAYCNVYSSVRYFLNIRPCSARRTCRGSFHHNGFY